MANENGEQSSGPDFGLDAEEQAAFAAMKGQADDPSVPPAADAPAEPALPDEGATAPVVTTEAATPAAEEDDEPDETATPAADGTRPPKRVSGARYRIVEAELKAEREKNAKSAETQARLDERLRLINEALTPAAQPQEDEDPEPDAEQDIFAHVAWQKRKVTRDYEAIQERIGQIEATRQTEMADQQLASTYMEDAHRFAQAEPNFGPAYAWLMNVRAAQLASYHFGKDLHDPATPPLTAKEITQIRSEVAREERALVGQAIKAGKSPAAAVFSMARMTGFQPQAPAAAQPASGSGQAAPSATAAPRGNGGAPSPAARPTVKAEIDRIKSAAGASLSLSQGGGTPAPVLNAQKLADMPQDEFDRLLNNVSRAEFQRIMGEA